MFHNPPQPLVHLTRPQQFSLNNGPNPQSTPSPKSQPDAEVLPRGGCRFLIPDSDGSVAGSRHRCSCQGFWLDRSLPGSQCACGHQAWHHVPEAPNTGVSLEEHAATLKKVKRLEDELEREKARREEEIKNVYKAIQGVYSSLALVHTQYNAKFTELDDKIEGTLDKAQESLDAARTLQQRVGTIDESTMDLENRIEVLESEKATNKAASPEAMQAELAVPAPAERSYHPSPKTKVEEKMSEAWNVKTIFVPRPTQQFAFEPGSRAYARCVSRNLHRDVSFTDASSRCFVRSIDEAFADVLRNRAWMPLICYRSENTNSFGRMTLQRLAPDDTKADFWNYHFLEKHCMTHEKGTGDIIYITFRDDHALSWEDIKALPVPFGADQSCWEFDDELDRNVEILPGKMDLDFKLNPPRGSTLSQQFHLPRDSSLSAPPPYTTQNQPQPTLPAMQPHPFEHNYRLTTISVASASSSTMSPPPTAFSPAPSMISPQLPPILRSPIPRHPLSDTHSILSHSSTGDSIHHVPQTPTSTHHDARSVQSQPEIDLSDDEHMSKKMRMRLGPQTGRPPTPKSTGKQAVYVSGRSKRKINLKERDPGQPKGINKFEQWREGFLHRKTNNDKDSIGS